MVTRGPGSHILLMHVVLPLVRLMTVSEGALGFFVVSVTVVDVWFVDCVVPYTQLYSVCGFVLRSRV